MRNIDEYINESIVNAWDFGCWMFERQTDEEWMKGETIENNGIGFNSPDAQYLTPMFKHLYDYPLVSQRAKYAPYFDKWVREHLRPRLLKYTKQFKVYSAWLDEEVSEHD
jgi:hypothetical protein